MNVKSTNMHRIAAKKTHIFVMYKTHTHTHTHTLLFCKRDLFPLYLTLTLMIILHFFIWFLRQF